MRERQTGRERGERKRGGGERASQRVTARAGEPRRTIISVTSAYLINMCIEMVAWRVFRAIIKLANGVTSSR